MKELQDIIWAYDAAVQNGKQTALATVVQVTGSSYRRPGARMLVTEDGHLTGAISGGCLEGDALRKARLAMAQQKPLLVTYDTTDEDDAKLGVGLGCNGIIQILIQPIKPEASDNPIAFLKRFLDERRPGILVTLFSLQNRTAWQPGACLFFSETGSFSGPMPEGAWQQLLLTDTQAALQTDSSRTTTYQTPDSSLTAFIELLKPPVSLVIVGAGNDTVPLAQFANILGWPVTVVDGRANYATPERFPWAQRVLVAKPEQVLPQVPIDRQTVFVLMTHNYNYDLAMLRQLVHTQAAYIGALGPKKKLERMATELADAGFPVTDDQMQKIYGPTGLEIGAETAEEIALSIIAEIKAVLAQAPGTSLRNKPEPIHYRPTELGQFDFQPYIEIN
jgi:xanthine/CO dehydrogenase XdhC/CoxF family maturation factor